MIYALISQTDKAFMYLTCKFLHCSRRGNEYIFISHNFDSNVTMNEPVQNLRAYILTTV